MRNTYLRIIVSNKSKTVTCSRTYDCFIVCNYSHYNHLHKILIIYIEMLTDMEI